MRNLLTALPHNTGNSSRRTRIASTPWRRRRSVRITTSPHQCRLSTEEREPPLPGARGFIGGPWSRSVTPITPCSSAVDALGPPRPPGTRRQRPARRCRVFLPGHRLIRRTFVPLHGCAGFKWRGVQAEFSSVKGVGSCLHGYRPALYRPLGRRRARKYLLAQQLQTCAALGRRWIGMDFPESRQPWRLLRRRPLFITLAITRASSAAGKYCR